MMRKEDFQPHDAALETNTAEVTDYEVTIDQTILRNFLKQGFRFSFTRYGRTSSFVSVMTRFEDDLFHITADSSDTLPLKDSKDFVYFGVNVRRRKLVPPQPGSATREIWRLDGDSRKGVDETFQVRQAKGGELDPNEFWRRFNASQVDEEATQELFQIDLRRERERTRGLVGMRVDVSWVANEEAEVTSQLSDSPQRVLTTGTE